MKTKQVAKKLAAMGEGGDTMLAHINPEEAGMLKAMGGSGKKNPKTGLLSFEPEGWFQNTSGYINGYDAQGHPTYMFPPPVTLLPGAQAPAPAVAPPAAAPMQRPPFIPKFGQQRQGLLNGTFGQSTGLLGPGSQGDMSAIQALLAKAIGRPRSGFY